MTACMFSKPKHKFENRLTASVLHLKTLCSAIFVELYQNDVRSVTK